jgi:tRNA threonylcarbamoyladenosine biosynthesis protein TsaE
MQHYGGRRPINHLDAYRIRNEEEFLDLGPDEYFDGEGLVLVEWADRVAGSLPRERVEIEIEVSGPESRRMKITSIGTRYDATLERLKVRMKDEG